MCVLWFHFPALHEPPSRRRLHSLLLRDWSFPRFRALVRALGTQPPVGIFLHATTFSSQQLRPGCRIRARRYRSGARTLGVEPFLDIVQDRKMIRYYVTDRRQKDILLCAARAIRDGVAMIQIREKDLPARELFHLACRVHDL